MATTWKPTQYNHKFEKSQLLCKTVKAEGHPLKQSYKVTAKQDTKRSSTAASKTRDPLSSILGGDPLSLLTDGSDPLSVLALGTEEKYKSTSGTLGIDKEEDDGAMGDIDADFVSWNQTKGEILSKYTTSDKLSIITSFLTAPNNESTRTIKASITVSDKVKNRLEQLDDFEDGSVKEMMNLSQQDYVKRIDELHKALVSAWNRDERVKALKIAIQSSKLLADSSVMKFYPSKFVLITEILDTFGRLVFERIQMKSTYKPSAGAKSVPLPADFTPEQVPESAKETCRNWFYKIASIRELIPRFYVEASILKCYRFFKPSEMTAALSRLADMIRGIGDPLVANYGRCYLCRVGIIIDIGRKEHVKQCLDDIRATFGQIETHGVMESAQKQNIPRGTYLSLYSPALDWVVKCIAHQAPEDQLVTILAELQQGSLSGLMLNSLLQAFEPRRIAEKAVSLVHMIRECNDAGFPKHTLYTSLGVKLGQANPPENDKMKILNDVWKFITKLKEPDEYIMCAETWIDFVMKYFGRREMNTVLADVIKHMTPDRAFEDFYPNILAILRKVLDHVHNYSLLFSLEKFLPFVDLFQKDSIKIQASRTIVESFVKYQLEPISDPVVVNTIMFMCKSLHDSVNALSLDDEKRSVSKLICSFIHIVDYGNNFEQQLTFYVESRANFTNLDSVMADLVQCVNNLSITTRRIVRGNHSKKTSAFVRACAAYCFITIPSLQSIQTQLNLYLLSAQVALLNRCLSQAESLFKAGIAAVLEMPRLMLVDGKQKSTDPYVAQYINNFLSALLVVPDNPDQGVLVLLKGLVNVIKEYKFERGSEEQVPLYLSVLALLTALSQSQYQYRVDRVESNDTLYGHDEKFLAEVSKIGSTIIEVILEYMKTLADGFDNLKKQSRVALTTMEHLLVYADLGETSVIQLIKNLWNLSQKHGYADAKQTAGVLSLMKKKGSSSSGLQQLVMKIIG